MYHVSRTKETRKLSELLTMDHVIALVGHRKLGKLSIVLNLRRFDTNSQVFVHQFADPSQEWLGRLLNDLLLAGIISRETKEKFAKLHPSEKLIRQLAQEMGTNNPNVAFSTRKGPQTVFVINVGQTPMFENSKAFSLLSCLVSNWKTANTPRLVIVGQYDPESWSKLSKQHASLATLPCMVVGPLDDAQAAEIGSDLFPTWFANHKDFQYFAKYLNHHPHLLTLAADVYNALPATLNPRDFVNLLESNKDIFAPLVTNSVYCESARNRFGDSWFSPWKPLITSSTELDTDAGCWLRSFGAFTSTFPWIRDAIKEATRYTHIPNGCALRFLEMKSSHDVPKPGFYERVMFSQVAERYSMGPG